MRWSQRYNKALNNDNVFSVSSKKQKQIIKWMFAGSTATPSWPQCTPLHADSGECGTTQRSACTCQRIQRSAYRDELRYSRLRWWVNENWDSAFESCLCKFNRQSTKIGTIIEMSWETQFVLGSINGWLWKAKCSHLVGVWWGNISLKAIAFEGSSLVNKEFANKQRWKGKLGHGS